MIWATKRVYKTGRGGQGPGQSAGHLDEGRDEKGLTAGGTSQWEHHTTHDTTHDTRCGGIPAEFPEKKEHSGARAANVWVFF
jgi:hypothetical protein